MSQEVEVTRTHPVPDPGIPEHVERWADVDPEESRRAERQVAACFGAVPLLALGFVVVYFFVPRTWSVQFAGLNAQAQNFWLGLLGGVAILLVPAVPPLAIVTVELLGPKALAFPAFSQPLLTVVPPV